MPPVVSAISATTSAADQHGSLTPADEVVDMAGLRQAWAQVPDPRDRRGRRYPLALMLALVQAAIVSGAVSSAAIRHWIARAPQEVLAQLGAQRDRRTGLFQAPHPDTVCRTIAQVNATYVDTAYTMHRTGQLRELYDDPDELIPMTVDGKTQRGTATPGTPADIDSAHSWPTTPSWSRRSTSAPNPTRSLPSPRCRTKSAAFASITPVRRGVTVRLVRIDPLEYSVLTLSTPSTTSTSIPTG